MYPTAGNAIPEKFLGRYSRFTGDPSPVVPPCQNTFLREQAEQDIKTTSVNLDANVTNIFYTHMSECMSYVQAHGEVPFTDPVRLGAQVILLRAQDIANQGKALDVGDEESLQQIECTEQGLQDINSPDMYSALSFPVQGAIKIALDQLSAQCIRNGWSGSMADLIQILSSGSIPAGSSNGFSDNTRTAAGLFNHFDLSSIFGGSDSSGDDSTGDTVDLAPDMSGVSLATIDPGMSSVGALGGATVGVGGSGASVSPASLFPSISGSGSAVASAPSQSGVLGFLSNVTSVAGQLSTAAQGIATSVNSSKSAINSVLSGIGANSIQKYVQQNPMIAILAVLLVIGVIIIAVRFGKGSN